MQKKWLEQREARKKQLIQAKMASNLTDEQWWAEYYRYYRHDLNKSPPTGIKSQRRPMKQGMHSKSKRRKQHRQPIQTNSVESLDILTSATTSTASATDAPTTTSSSSLTTTTLPITPFVTVESTTTLATAPTTAGITKSIDELQPNIRDATNTSEINSSTQINDRMSLNESTTSRINEISTTAAVTTEHSITYNVTVDKLNRAQIVHKFKSRKLSNAVWGRWQKWTKCSRSCGGGVMSQSRQCLSR